jgi:hypothetical protein
MGALVAARRTLRAVWSKLFNDQQSNQKRERKNMGTVKPLDKIDTNTHAPKLELDEVDRASMPEQLTEEEYIALLDAVERQCRQHGYTNARLLGDYFNIDREAALAYMKDILQHPAFEPAITLRRRARL